MWLKNTFPACTSKAGKKKNQAFKGKRGQDGALREVFRAGIAELRGLEKGALTSWFLIFIPCNKCAQLPTDGQCCGASVWRHVDVRKIGGEGWNHTVFLYSDLSLALSHGRCDDVWLCASSWWRGLCALGVSPSDTGPCHRWATNRCWCHCDHCYTGGLEPHSFWHEENLSLILEIPSAF